MLIIINKEDIVSILQEQISSWEDIGGGPIYDAFEFDPRKISPQELKALGYYENRDAWIAGVQIKKLKQYLEEVQAANQFCIS